jgi:hypothetical protein
MDPRTTVSWLDKGRAVARHSGFLMTLQNVEIKDVGAEFENVSDINAGKSTVAWNQAIGVIHPNGIRVNLGWIRVSRIDPEKSIPDVTLYCEGARVVKTVIDMGPPPS